MKTRLTDRQLRRFYRLLSVRMTDFDCGRLCAPANGGVPRCCDATHVVPVLYRDEFRWQRRQGRFWRRMPVRTRAERKLVEQTHPYNVFALCPGVEGCRRGLRALVCRMYPFEPHVNDDGRVTGLAFQDESKRDCPLIRRPRRAFNDRYIANSLRVWQELLDALSHERDMYIAESRKRERRWRRTGRPSRLFR